jgi:NTP pyrophosphatase (non-canonical NTP hydrolase)
MLNEYARTCHKMNSRWWVDPITKEPIQRNKGELMMLIVSELAEAMEAERKDLFDAHLPSIKGVDVELADALIRIFDYAGAFGIDLDRAYTAKMEYNNRREDHTHEHRLKAGGKKW